MTTYQLNEQTTKFLNEHKLFQDDEIQQIQLQHRLSLVEAFNLPKGGRILEIGCGQGDTTMAIAHSIGHTGKVVAIDNASRDYGSPFTLGQATDHILQSSLGERITFHLETDFNNFEVEVPFDVAVFSHCSWYFKNPFELLGFLKRVRGLAKRICFAEWDLQFTEMSQRSHFVAVSILALYSQFVENESNVQNLFNKSQIQQLLEQAGFQIEKDKIVDATFLPDAKWEKGYANSIRTELVQAAPRMETLLTSYYELMNECKDEERSLNSFVITAS
ncbi:class I SAM-dependent methyltransferase [Sporosarcina sp. BI001-red]|uniref:SAM-dependent methyltransferase n=1 Tax=Sporosarcina sp. BI001-red TaxID=2282866 RepID=UPI000E253C54|nr:class I SAM-dependent methyltransferase [Sporosarcina sp. BI001-red]REB07266.1 class I SAM-dependent methyltransferase [Sporosarcina sp. BI001-red]